MNGFRALFRRVALPVVSVVILNMAGVAPTRAQSATELTVAKIMRDPNTWIGASPSNPKWSEDGRWLYFSWNPMGQFPSDSLYRVARTGGVPEQVPPSDRRAARASFDGWKHGENVYDASFARKVFAYEGDLYLVRRSDGVLTRLTQTVATESEPRFSPDGKAIVYRSGNQLFRLDLATGGVRQLTDLQSGEKPVEDKPSPRDAWLKSQQTELFDVLRERQEKRKLGEQEAERDRAARGVAPTFHFGKGVVTDLKLDPSERFATFVITDEPPATRTFVQDYVTESGHASTTGARAKVGVEPPVTRLFVQDLARDTTYQVDFGTLSGIHDVVPEHLALEGAKVDSTVTRAVEIRRGAIRWSPDGSFAVVDIWAFDTKDRWIARLDPGNGSLTVLDRQHDPAWGITWAGSIRSRAFVSTGWLPDGRTCWFVSEKTGFAHLYTVDVVTGEIRQLTSGDFEVYGVELSRDGSTWFLTTSEGSPFERHLWRMPRAGGARTRVTSLVGSNEAVLNPDEQRVAILYSFTTSPPEIYLQTMGRDAERVTHSTTAEWEAYPWRTGEIVRIPASDSVLVPAQVFRPEEPNGGAVLFVHGAGYAQNVHRWWPSYFREYMFHNLLADRGYTVVNVDYRASSGYGRDWRTAIYRYMGGRDLQDEVDTSVWLGSEYGIDPERVFIYGGSYGGFMTLMALFTEPEHFGGGAALRSVTDWAHYNHWYASAILNTPTTDSLAYARSSPINFADGLEDPLLMAHGVVDDNVQYQDILRLTQRLIELGKTGWELASYPVEPHGFTEPSSWTDEYRRILELIEETVGPDRRR